MPFPLGDSTLNNSETKDYCYKARIRSTVLQGLPFGGIPTVLALDFLCFLLLLFLFSVLRKVAWDYGRLALVTDVDSMSSAMQADSHDRYERLTSVSSSVDFEQRDNGFCSWLTAIFRIKKEQVYNVQEQVPSRQDQVYSRQEQVPRRQKQLSRSAKNLPNRQEQPPNRQEQLPRNTKELLSRQHLPLIREDLLSSWHRPMHSRKKLLPNCQGLVCWKTLSPQQKVVHDRKVSVPNWQELLTNSKE